MSVAVLADAEAQNMANQMIWTLDWSSLRHSTFTTKQGISWQKLPGFIAEKMIFTNYCSVVGGMTFSFCTLGVCVWVALCLAVFRCSRPG